MRRLTQSIPSLSSVPYLCAAGEQPVKLTDTGDASPIVWVDGERILFVDHGPPAADNLRLQRLGEPSVLLDTVSSSEFDYTYVDP